MLESFAVDIPDPVVYFVLCDLFKIYTELFIPFAGVVSVVFRW